MNYFEVFDLPRTLNIDLAALEKSFYELSRKHHPDFHTRSEPEKRRQALQMTALLNDAYRTLKHPVRRVEYLVGLEGFKPDGSKVPKTFLMEVFEINERLDEIKQSLRAGSASSASSADVEALRGEIREKSENFDSRIGETSREWDRLVMANAAGSDKKKCLEQLTELLSESSYIRNLERELEDRT